MKKFFDQVVEELGNTTIRFWDNPDVTRASIITLLSSSAVLLTLCRLPFFDTGLSSVIILFLSFIMQFVACLAFLLKGKMGQESAKAEVAKCFRLLVMVWITTLFLFVHNLFPALRLARYIPYPFLTAVLYSGAAVLLWAAYTVRLDHHQHPEVKVDYRGIAIWSLVVGAVNTSFLYLFVLDMRTTDFITDNLDTLNRLFS
jgi:hypothetical protein